jgi:xanthine dehydrogenase/oxidase
MFITEQIMYRVAEQLGMPIDKLRRINLYKEGDPCVFDQPLRDFHVPLILDRIQVEADYARRVEEVARFNATHRWKKRGICMVNRLPRFDYT